MPADVYVEFMMEFEPSPEVMERLSELARAAASVCLASENRSGNQSEVSVVFCDDPFIAELNMEYRGVEGPTDVLSFALHEGEEAVLSPAEDVPDMLGDIVISVDTARAQAKAAGKTLEEEIGLLLVHGMLHLLGYDHDTPEKEAIMWKRQGENLDALRAMVER